MITKALLRSLTGWPPIPNDKSKILIACPRMRAAPRITGCENGNLVKTGQGMASRTLNTFIPNVCVVPNLKSNNSRRL